MGSSPAPGARGAFSESDPHGTGVVVGRPRVWLRIEGLALLGAALVAYARTGQAWWIVPTTLLLPDLGALGYLASRRTGAWLYNLTHTTSLPLALVGFGLWQQHALAVALAVVWLAHIGMDRVMAYGMKYDDEPGHTHLGLHGHQQVT